MATESAGTMKISSPLNCGRASVGSAEGISAVSPTSATPMFAKYTVAVEIRSAIGKANVDILVRPTPRITATVRSATAAVGMLIAPGWSAASIKRSVLLAYSLLYPVTSATCDKMMLTATPVRNPRITEFETNLTSVPALRAPKTIWMTPTSSVSEIRATALCSAGIGSSASATIERHRASYGHRHQLRTRGERGYGRADDQRVQAVNRVQPRERGVCHAVGDVGDRVGEAGEYVTARDPLHGTGNHLHGSRGPLLEDLDLRGLRCDRLAHAAPLRRRQPAARTILARERAASRVPSEAR